MSAMSAKNLREMTPDQIMATPGNLPARKMRTVVKLDQYERYVLMQGGTSELAGRIINPWPMKLAKAIQKAQQVPGLIVLELKEVRKPKEEDDLWSL